MPYIVQQGRQTQFFVFRPKMSGQSKDTHNVGKTGMLGGHLQPPGPKSPNVAQRAQRPGIEQITLTWRKGHPKIPNWLPQNVRRLEKWKGFKRKGKLIAHLKK